MYSAPVSWQPHYSDRCAPPCLVAWIAVPVQYPSAPCPAPQSCEVVQIRELAVDGAVSTEADFIGGHSDASLTVEYVADTSTGTPAVEVKLESPESTTTWNATELADGYHAQEAVLTAAPGSKVALTATNAIARLRWCERICC